MRIKLVVHSYEHVAGRCCCLCFRLSFHYESRLSYCLSSVIGRGDEFSTRYHFEIALFSLSLIDTRAVFPLYPRT
jgi:hypothetical protein